MRGQPPGRLCYSLGTWLKVGVEVTECGLHKWRPPHSGHYGPGEESSCSHLTVEETGRVNCPQFPAGHWHPGSLGQPA